MLGRKTTDILFLLQRLPEEYGEKDKNCTHAFVDVEKACHLSSKKSLPEIML